MTTCMDLEGIMISVREDKYCMKSLICGIKKKKKKPKSQEKRSDTQLPEAGDGEGGTDCMNMAKRYILPVINKY